MSSDPRKNLRPFDIVVRACSEQRATFTSSFCGSKLLLVGLKGASEGLVRGLLECPTDRDQPWYPRSESTGTKTEFGRIELGKAEAAKAAGHGSSSSANGELDEAGLRVLLSEPHFVMPLNKRPESEMLDPEKISVGRSRRSDIVLYHPSISKRHAYLEYDDRDHLYVSDSGSTNFTRVRGVIASEGEVIPFSFGHEVRFGDVFVRVVTPSMLWSVLNPDSDSDPPY